MLLSSPPIGNRGRKAVFLNLTPSAEFVIWSAFTARFLETYGSRYPWDGAGTAWPTIGNAHATSGRAPWDGMQLPREEQNAAALARIVELTRGDTSEALARIERLFRERRVASIGLSLPVVADWWDAASSTAQLLRETHAVSGGLA